MGIERDDGADLAFERLFGGHLEIEVDGEAEVFAGDGECLAEVAELLAVAVHDDIADSHRCRAGGSRRSASTPERPTTSPGS